MYEAIKSLGQNFLTDANVVKEFVSHLNIEDGDTVIEIGAGLGVLTQEISEYILSRPVVCYAIEIDPRFTPKLNGMFTFHGNLNIVEDDALRWLPNFKHEGIVKVIGALPFYITSPLLHAIIKMENQPDTVVLLVQKEVAKKISAPAPDSSYLSVFAQTFYDVKYRGEVSRKKFKPSPNVDGGIITMKKKNISISPDILIKYEGFLHKGFASPRKMLNKAFKREELLLGEIKPDLRPEALPAEKWFAFFKKLNNMQK